MLKQPVVRIALTLSFLWLGGAFGATPDATTPDGGRYFGPLVNGKLHGRGRLEWPNGSVYEGEFARGLMSGKGRFNFANGARYEGEMRDGMMSGRGRFEMPEREVYEGQFKLDLYWGAGEVKYHDGRRYRGDFARGEFEGKGRFEMANGEVYEGEFRRGDFVKGRFSRPDGSHYEGAFSNWLFNGPGRFVDMSGMVWEGHFQNGTLSGRGKVSGHGAFYEGDLQQSVFHGQGVLRLPNGDVYEGGFENGMYEGQGTLTYAKPRPDGTTKQTGVWRYGTLPDEGARKQVNANIELALYGQKDLLDKALASLKPRDPGKINLYFLGVAGDGSQEVFRREVEFVQGDFARRFKTEGRSVALINSRSTAASAPMATMTSIRQALNAIASRMDREQDILFLFMTSHGSQTHELSLNQDGIALPDLPATELAAMLRESRIKWKVVVVSACYAGGFIKPLHDEGTLVITAARHDRRSFGCADENDFTYFGRAFFKEALPKSRSFQEAFKKAEALVGDWERKDHPVDENRSLPQFSSATAIDAHLRRWWAQTVR